MFLHPMAMGLMILFMPYISDEIIEVQSYSIMSANGDTLIFSRPTFIYSQYESYAWNGNRFTGSGVFASQYVGLFKYGMRLINKAGRSQVLEGEACVIRCGKESKIFKTKEGCYYPEQADATNQTGKSKGNGKLDKNIISKEKNCF